jgi:predicted ribosome quality control (RQC) complex YloA/Tae2 family protein
LSYFDLRIITRELKTQLENYRLNNIYDLPNNGGFLLNFRIPDSKKSLVINPGFQIHLTEFTRDTPPTPSSFVAKLRKHLKSRRLTRVELAANDRVIVFSFSDNYDYHLVLEFFAGGNMILLNSKFQIMDLLHTVSAAKTQNFEFAEKYSVGVTYDVDSMIKKDPESDKPVTAEQIKEWFSEVKGQTAPTKRKSKGFMLRNYLYVKLPHLSSSLLEESLFKFEVDPTKLVTQFDLNDTEALGTIAEAVNDSIKFADSLLESESITGYIVTQKNPQYTGEPTEKEGFVDPIPITQAGNFVDPRTIEYTYTDYQPYKPSTNEKLVQLSSFNSTVDHFYSTIEATKLSLRLLNKEQNLEKRLEAARREKEKRLEGLTEIQIKNEKLGLALQLNSEAAEEAANAIRGFIDQKMDWKDIEQLIKVEQSRKNPLAQMIALPLDLSKNKIKLNLPDPDFIEDDESDSESSESESDSELDEDEEESSKKNKPGKRASTVKVDFDLGLSAWANSRKYFDVKRTAAAKKEKTIKSANIALKSAEKKIQRDIAASKAEDSQIYGLRNIREPFMFEKFYWFVSTEGYLVLAGHDNMQNQILFRRYFQPNDILVTADIDGASIVIIKNKPGSEEEIPPSTISQAGAFAAATSQKAWDSKMNPRTWYGRFEDIDKITKDGKLVPIDNIEVRGGRNIILYQSMDMGLGFIWLLDNDGEIASAKEEATAVLDEGETADKSSNDDSDSDDDLFGDSDVKLSDIIAKNANSARSPNQPEPLNEPQVVEEVSEPVDEKEEEVEEEEEEEEEEQSPEPEEPDNEVEKSDEEEQENEVEEQEQEEETNVEPIKSKSSKNNRKKSPAFDDSDKEDPDSIVLDIEKRLQMLSASTKKKSGNSGQQPPKVKSKKNKKKGSNTNSEEPSRVATPKPAGGAARGKKLSKKEKEQEARERHRLAEINRKERQKKADQAELQKLLAAANNQGDEQNTEELKGLLFPAPRFSFKLEPGQKPLAAVPVFGPWDSISKQIKYRIKLSPGTTKKGKAVKDILHSLSNIQKFDTTQTDPDYAWPIEVSLIKALKPSEILLPIAVSKMTVYMPNVSGNSGGNLGGSGSKGGKGKGGKGGR